jgi:2-polyprenyl-3-methyl-5-hydroxy-6-metoxy-1,4-benzoquinol methylase
MKILAAIANFGTKNLPYLETVLNAYRSMSRYRVDLVVLSNIPKHLGPDIEVKVGLPTKDPWSLPFAHKQLFAQRVDDYDLFVYSEDDTLIAQHNIDAFVDVTQVLPEECIAGFLRYEVSPDGRRYYSTIHGSYHWDPHSVFQIAGHVFAHFTNEHSACFILTRRQLERAIASGGFLSPPRQGRYDMLVTAATDPYTQCGMKKVICVSRLEEFSLHHLPNAYCGRMGRDADSVNREVAAVKAMCDTNGPRGPLFDTRTLLEDTRWDAQYYSPSRADVIALVPDEAGTILSVGCGCGTTESSLVRQGREVVAIPLDCVMKEAARDMGLRMLPPSFGDAKRELAGCRFDCIILMDVLQHLADPVSTIAEWRGLLRSGGCMVVSVPNFHHISLLRRRLRGQCPYSGLLRRYPYDKFRLHFTNRRVLRSWLRKGGMKLTRTSLRVDQRYEVLARIMPRWVKSVLSSNVVALARALW